jgi:hypothetical protein
MQTLFEVGAGIVLRRHRNVAIAVVIAGGGIIKDSDNRQAIAREQNNLIPIMGFSSIFVVHSFCMFY